MIGAPGHDVAVTSSSPLARRLASTTALVLLLAGVGTGCGGSGSDPADSPSSSTPSTPGSAGSAGVEPEPYLEVPEGVELTEPGRSLFLGDSATVAWKPRQNLIGVLDIKVLGVERTTFKKSFKGWKLDEATKKTTPYFVRAKLSNVGDTKLGKQSIPLYIVDSSGTLVQPSRFSSRFDPCPGSPEFPPRFAPDAKTKTCLVYLAPDGTELSAVSFRPTQEFNPITWNGPVEKIGKPKPKKQKKPKQKAGDGGRQKNG